VTTEEGAYGKRGLPGPTESHNRIIRRSTEESVKKPVDGEDYYLETLGGRRRGLQGNNPDK